MFGLNKKEVPFLKTKVSMYDKIHFKIVDLGFWDKLNRYLDNDINCNK